MKLLHAPASPYARKVRMVAREKGLMDRIAEIQVQAMQDPPELRAVNPLGKIPALIREDGSALYDSPVIAAYLDQAGGAPFLIAQDGEAHWRVRRLEALADGVMDAAVSLRIEDTREAGVRNGDWIARWKRGIAGALDQAARESDDLAATFDLGAIAWVAALGYLDLRHPSLVWRQGRPRLAAWFERASQRESAVATAPE